MKKALSHNWADTKADNKKVDSGILPVSAPLLHKIPKEELLWLSSVVTSHNLPTAKM